MFGLSSNFDLVIGNPPYVRQEAIKDQKPLLENHYGGKGSQGQSQGRLQRHGRFVCLFYPARY